jgi:hypothetical protein
MFLETPGERAAALDALGRDVSYRTQSALLNTAAARECSERSLRAQTAEQEDSERATAEGHLALARSFIEEARQKLEEMRRCAALAAENARRISTHHGFHSPHGDDGGSAASDALTHARAACGAAAAQVKRAVQDAHDVGAVMRDARRARQVADLRFACPALSQGECEAALDSGSYFNLLRAASVGDNLLNYLEHLEARHAAIARLNADLVDLLALMRALQEIVDACGDSLAHIEVRVTQAFEYATDAERNLDAASDYQTRIRKRKCILITIFIVLAAAIAGVAAGVIAVR